MMMQSERKNTDIASPDADADDGGGLFARAIG
jgi:hypothetical protein